MAVDNNASTLAPTPVTAEQHHKPSLKERIDKIFNKNQPPKKTLEELATIDPNESISVDKSSESNIDNLPKPPENQIVVDPKPESPPVDTTALQKEDDQQTAEDIKKVTEIIQQESTPKVEAVVETPKTLFPESPPLFDKYHQSYEKEKKTIKGSLNRSQDISVLRGRGKDRRDNRREVSELYDCLRSHGLSREQILAKGPDKKLLLWQDIQDSTKQYINNYPEHSYYYSDKTTPFKFDAYHFSSGIERLDSLGRFDSNFLNSPEKFNQTIRDAVSIGRIQKTDFEDIKNKLNNFQFLSNQNIISFFVKGKYNEDRYESHPHNTLVVLQKEFFSTPENEAKFNKYLNEHPEISRELFNGVLNRSRKGNYESINPLTQALVGSEINPGEKIVLPYKSIHESGWYSDELRAFHNLDTREQQRFLSKQINLNADPNKDLIGHYFNRDKKPNSNFYKDFIVDSYNLEKVVTLPDGQIIDSTTDLSTEEFFKFLSISSSSSEYKPFFDSVLNLKDLDPNIFCYVFLDKSKIAQYFDQNNQLTSNLFKDIAHEFSPTHWYYDEIKIPAEAFQKFFTSNLTPDITSSFSSEDQQFWNNVLNLKDINKYSFQRLFIDSSYLSSEGKLTPEFLKEFCEHHPDPDQFKFITSNITPEDVKTFPSLEDQKFWSRFINLKNQYSAVYDFMVDNQSQFDSFFTPDNLPTSLFFQEYIKYQPTHSSSSNPLKTDWIISNLTQDVLINFSLEDQKFWSIISGLNGLSNESIKIFFKSDVNSVFTETGQPKAYFFEVLAKNGNLSLLKSNLTSEIIQTFSLEDQKFWKTFSITKNNELKSSLIENKLNYEANDLTFIVNTLKSKDLDKAGALFGDFLQSRFLDLDSRLSSPIGLCGWRVFQEYLSDHNIKIEDLDSKTFDKILQKAQEEAIKKVNYTKKSELDLPEGLRVSIGTEIEIMLNGIFRTGKVSKDEIIDYKKSIASLKLRPSSFIEEYVNDLAKKIEEAKRLYRVEVSKATDLGIGRGNDAVHEFANEPVTNYSILLWELYEISRLGFISFDRKLLQHIERGMHLTISGDKDGISLDKNSRLLQTSMLISGWSDNGLDAVGSSEIVDSVEDDSKKLFKQIKGYILERHQVKTSVFGDHSEHPSGVENRAIGINSFNHLARTIQTFYQLAIPLKAYQDYFGHNINEDSQQVLSTQIKENFGRGIKLSQITEKSEEFLPEVKDERIRKSIISWAYYREATTEIFSQKQKLISRYKLKSPLETYNDRDMTRLGSELFEVFGGVDDTGNKLEDALASYHMKPEENSISVAQRELIIEVKREIRNIFKKV